VTAKLRSGNLWKDISSIKLRSGGVWKNVSAAYLKVSGAWKIFFGIDVVNEPSIAQTVTLVTSSSSMPATLTGRNYRWTNATTLTYKFQYDDGSQWLDGNGTNATGTITNPSAGSSNTKTYTPVIGDFPSSSETSTGSFRFVVTATNTNVSPTLQTVSTSDTVSVENVITITPVIPTISMGSNSGISQTAGTINWTSTNQASFSSTGTFSGTGTTGTSISKTGLTAGTTYTGTVTVTSSTGDTASANYSLTTSAAVQPPVSQTDPVLTQTSENGMSVTSGSWTNNPTAYRYRWYELVNNDSIDIKRDITNSNTSDSYSGIQGNDYLVQVTASNSGGSASEFSNVLFLKSPPSGGSVSLTGNNTPGSTIYAETPENSWLGSPTSYSVIIAAAVSPNIPTTSSTIVAFSINSNNCSYVIESSDTSPARIFKAFASATNEGGTSSVVGSTTITAAPAPPTCTAEYLPYGDWEYKDSNGNDTSWSSCVNNSQTRDKRRARDYQNADCSTSGPYYEYGTDTQSCTVTCTAGCGSYGDIVYGTYTDCVNCSKSRTRSQTRTCVNTDCTTYSDTLNLTDENTSCSCPTFEGDWSPYGAYGPYGPCGAVGCLAIKIRTRSSTRIVQDACCNITTQTRTQDQSTYCTVTKYTCNNFDVTNPNSTNYFDCFSVGACTAPRDPSCGRTACQFS
jgi:hypothetical protein